MKPMFFTLVAVVALFAVESSASEIPRRIGTAKQGEWISYKFGKNISRKFIVVGHETKDGERYVTIKSQTIMGKGVMQEDESSYPVANADILLKDFPNVNPEAQNKTITIKGKEYDAVVFSGVEKGMKYTLYFSEEIPVFGLLRVDLVGEKFFEMDECGFGDE